MMAGVLEEILMSLFALDIDHYLFSYQLYSSGIKRFKDVEWKTILI